MSDDDAELQAVSASLVRKRAEIERRCCKGCPDCIGIGVRQHIAALTAENRALRHECHQHCSVCDGPDTCALAADAAVPEGGTDDD